MGRKKADTPEEIVAKLRQAEVLVGQVRTVADAVRAIGVTEATYYRWRTEFGGLKLDQVKRLKELERENARLRKRRWYFAMSSGSKLPWRSRGTSSAIRPVSVTTFLRP